MSLYEEQKYAINRSRDFLYALLDPKQTPRVPRSIRQQAGRCLRHWPIMLDMFLADAQKDPEVIRFNDEDLRTMCKDSAIYPVASDEE